MQRVWLQRVTKHKVRFLYLITVDYSMKTMESLLINQFVVHLCCQKLQHLWSRSFHYITVLPHHFTVKRESVELTWSTLRQAVEMLTISSCRDKRSLTRSRSCSSSKPRSCDSGICLSSWAASSKLRSVLLLTLLLSVQTNCLFITEPTAHVHLKTA